MIGEGKVSAHRHDLLIVGGGVNGAGIARDAAGRRLDVLLVEQDDLASHTSSASTKLIHGGLRYLEHREFRLVREALIERERLLVIAPHIIRPLRFVLPKTPGGRPGWLIRLGLLVYDNLGGERTLPGSSGVRLRGRPYGAGLRPDLANGFVYSDCWVDDARLVVLNAMDAAARGATVLTRTRLIAARRDGAGWTATIEDRDTGARRAVSARAIVNAAGPWVGDVLDLIGGAEARDPRLIKGSHIIVPRLYEGDHAYILQNPDDRVVFAIPYEGKFTLIGTTDVPWAGDPAAPVIDGEEIAYLCESMNRFFARPIGPKDVLRSYSGVRPLFDDGAKDPSAVTRDYVLELDAGGRAPILSVFGGKITTYRRLAEHALERLAPYLPGMGGPWSNRAALPGGSIPGGDFERWLGAIRTRWPFVPEATMQRMGHAYGTEIRRILGEARDMADLGEHFGGGLTTAEVDHLVTREWARTAEDILWRRTKIGLHVGPETAARIDGYIAAKAPPSVKADG